MKMFGDRVRRVHLLGLILGVCVAVVVYRGWTSGGPSTAGISAGTGLRTPGGAEAHLPVSPAPAPLAAPAVAAAPTHTGPPRVAVLGSGSGAGAEAPGVQSVAAWLEVGLSGEPGLVLLERATLPRVLDEAALALALGAETTPASRRGAFQPFAVDRLVLVRPNPSESSPEAVAVSVLDTATGLILGTSGVDPLGRDASADDDLRQRLVELAVEPLSSVTVFAVAPVADARLLSTDDALGLDLLARVREGLSGDGRLELELTEARALATELTIRGGSALTAGWRPWYVMLRVEDVPTGGGAALRAVLQHGGVAVAELYRPLDPADPGEAVAAVLHRFGPDLAAATPPPAQDVTELVADLARRAEQLRATAQPEASLALIETALLYDPGDVERRLTAVDLLRELMQRTLDTSDSTSDAYREQVRQATPRVLEWHARALDHLGQLVRARLAMSADNEVDWGAMSVYMRDHFRLASYRVPRERWPEVWTDLHEPMVTATDDFRFATLALIDRVGPVPAGGKTTFGIMSLLNNEETKIPDSAALITARLRTRVGHTRRIGDVQRYTFLDREDARIAPRVVLDAVNGLLAELEDEPWLWLRVEALRVAAAKRLYAAAYGPGQTPDGWPAGTGPVSGGGQAADGDDRWAGLLRASRAEQMPRITPRLLSDRSAPEAMHDPIGFAPCGRFGDVMWTETAIVLIEPSGRMKTLYPDAASGEMPTGRYQWVRNVNFDGRYLWALLPGTESRLVLIDPATGTRHEFDGDDGLPGSDSGGSVAPLGNGQAIAFGSFGGSKNLRTWYAKLHVADDGLTVELLRGDKSRFAGSDAAADAFSRQIRARYANRIAVCRDPEHPDRPLVIAGTSAIPRKNGKSNDRIDYIVIDPADGSISPANRNLESWIKEGDESWFPLRDGTVLVNESNGVRVFDPFADTDRTLRPSARMQALAEAPDGVWALLPLSGPGEHQTMLLYAAEPRLPPRPVALLDRHFYDGLIAWSEHQGLLVADRTEVATVSAEQLRALPPSLFDFGRLDRTDYDMLNLPLEERLGFRFAVFRDDARNQDPTSGWTLDQARAIAVAYDTVLLEARHLPGADKAHMHFTGAAFWTGVTTAKAAGRVTEADLLPPGAAGHPVVLTNHGLEVAEPGRRCDVILPYDPVPEDDALLRRVIPAVVELPAGTATIGGGIGNPAREVSFPPGLFMMSAELSKWQAVVLTDPDRLKRTDPEDQRRIAWWAETASPTTDAKAVCVRLRALTGENWRLPTEAEWEYACRAGSTTAYAGGNDVAALQSMGRFSADGPTATHPAWIMQHEPNAWGLYDMHGNVPEIALVGNDAERFVKAVADPDFKLYGGVTAMARGGGAWDPADRCRSDSRRPLDDMGTGIRLVLDRSGRPPTP